VQNNTFYAQENVSVIDLITFYFMRTIMMSMLYFFQGNQQLHVNDAFLWEKKSCHIAIRTGAKTHQAAQPYELIRLIKLFA
jgi:hypothetical protein